MRRSPISRAAERMSSSGETVTGRRVMTSLMRIDAKWLPSPARRTRSRSVKMPTNSGPSRTVTLPTFSSFMRATASDTGSWGPR